MARPLRFLRQPGVLITALLCVSPALLVADPSPSPAPTAPRHHRQRKPPASETLTSQQYQKFQRNLELWKTLPPDLREELRKDQDFRRKRILKEIGDAIAQSGLELDEEQRQVFTYRYAEGRRRIEENLRQEMERKRRAAVKRLIEQLVVEFTITGPEASPSPKPHDSGGAGAPEVAP